MPRRYAAWRAHLLSYPCPDCDAGPGERCHTSGGREAHDYVHAARLRTVERCYACGAYLPSDQEPGTLCDYCATVQQLVAERYRYPHRPGHG